MQVQGQRCEIRSLCLAGVVGFDSVGAGGADRFRENVCEAGTDEVVVSSRRSTIACANIDLLKRQPPQTPRGELAKRQQPLKDETNLIALRDETAMIKKKVSLTTGELSLSRAVVEGGTFQGGARGETGAREWWQHVLVEAGWCYSLRSKKKI